MHLYIMRHGQAQMTASSDAARQLTEQGFMEATKMGRFLSEQEEDISHVIVSPYIRAQQTASSVIESYGRKVKQETSSLYEPSSNPSNAHDFIDAHISLDNISGLLVVSHMPLVSYLVSELTKGASGPIFQTAAIAKIDYDESSMAGQLVSVISPND